MIEEILLIIGLIVTVGVLWIFSLICFKIKKYVLIIPFFLIILIDLIRYSFFINTISNINIWQVVEILIFIIIISISHTLIKNTRDEI